MPRRGGYFIPQLSVSELAQILRAEEIRKQKLHEKFDENDAMRVKVKQLEAESVELHNERDLLRSEKEAARFEKESLRFDKEDLLQILLKLTRNNLEQL